jgi:hypothetical protein
LEKGHIENLNDFIRRLKEFDGRIQELLFRVTNLYYNGLKERKIDYAFLSFWTCLEKLTLMRRGLNHIGVIRRLKSMLINLTSIEEHRIDRVYSLRNNLVHDGDADSILEEDRNLIKVYCELMIEFYIFNLQKYNYAEIDSIFEFLQKNPTDLAKSKDLIDYVVKLKQ